MTRVEFYTLGWGAYVGTGEYVRVPEPGAKVRVKPHHGGDELESKVRARRHVADDTGEDGRPYVEVELYLTSDEFGGVG